MRNVLFTPAAYDEFIHWHQTNKAVFNKINDLIVETTRDPFKGKGKPEPLKGNYAGHWSRRITQEHRLVYKVSEETISIVKCYGHYDD